MRDQFYQNIAHHIAAHGRSILSVFDTPPFTYSIGNALVGLPELLVLGLAPSDAQSLINLWSDRMVEHRPFFDGELVDTGGKFPVMAVVCADHVRTRYTIQAGQYLDREDYDVMQMILPDPAGRYPGDPLCEDSFRALPVLRARPAVLQ